MLPTRYWITASALPKKRLYLPVIKKVKVLPAPPPKEEKELIQQFALTEDGTPILITSEYTPQNK